MRKWVLMMDTGIEMIKVFETRCMLPDGTIGEVCAELKNGWLVCNAYGWWHCEKEWILKNIVGGILPMNMKFFNYSHLPQHLQEVSKPLGDLAKLMDETLPDCTEKFAGLRKLMEAKDCFVRAALERTSGDINA